MENSENQRYCRNVKWSSKAFISEEKVKIWTFFQKSSDVHLKLKRSRNFQCLHIPHFGSVTHDNDLTTNSWNKWTEAVAKPSALPMKYRKFTWKKVFLTSQFWI